MPLITRADVQQAGRIAAGDESAEIDRLILVVMARAERYLERKLTADTYTEYHDGGNQSIYVNAYPWSSISTLRDNYPENPRSITVSGNVRSEQEYKDRGEVLLYGSESLFAGATKAVEIVYTGGYTTTDFPEDLKRALIQQILFELGHWDRVGIASQSADGVSVEYDIMRSGFVREVQYVLDGYRNLYRAVV
jgi:hypothetical protein